MAAGVQLLGHARVLLLSGLRSVGWGLGQFWHEKRGVAHFHLKGDASICPVLDTLDPAVFRKPEQLCYLSRATKFLNELFVA